MPTGEHLRPAVAGTELLLADAALHLRDQMNDHFGLRQRMVYLER